MSVGRSEETALGSARGRFLESLPRKAIELRGAIALLQANPASEGPRADLRRKLHALYASALVFRSDALAALVQEGIKPLDAASEQKRALEAIDMETLASVVRRIAELRVSSPAESAVDDDGAARRIDSEVSARIASSAPPDSLGYSRSKDGPRRSATLTGLSPIGMPMSTPSEMPGRLVSRGSLFAADLRREAKRPMLQRVLHVLLVVAEDRLPSLRALLSNDSLRVSALSSVAEAISSALEDAPDVVLADARDVFAGGLLAALRADPLTDFVPIVAIASSDGSADRDDAREGGADEVVSEPLRGDQLLRVLGRVTGTLVEIDALLPGPVEGTIDEVCTRVSEEIRRGLVDAVESGSDLKVSLGEGAEVMAAAWAAVARVRALFTERSAGRVRFSDRPSSAAPALLSVGSGADGLAALAGASPLMGRRILVADDDTAVVLFFAGLLREEGATVTEVTDGAEALRAARRERPDLIISDVVMPGLSGFALCRELKRDPLLADVPVILISWKEDLLVRMRELSSGASGYLRKEAGAIQILSSVRDALRSRGQLEARLAEAGEVRGNLDGTGVVALLRSVRRTRPDARITLRDGWNLFECELRDGRLAQLTRTASDGSFVRNEAALPQLLGVSSGRFVVSRAEGSLRQAVEGTLDEALARGSRELGAQLDVLTGAALNEVERIVLDEDAQAGLLDQAPPLVRDVVARLAQGQPPRKVWQDGIIDQALLEPMLLDMAKRGAIRSVLGHDGSDSIEAARKERERVPATELGSPLSMLPPAPDPVISMLSLPDDAVLSDPTSAALDSALADGGVMELGPTDISSSMLPPPPPPEPELEPGPSVASAPGFDAEAAAVTEEAATQPVRESRTTDLRELERAAAEARSSRGTLWAWTAGFVALVAVGFLFDRAREVQQEPRLEAIGVAPEPAPEAKPAKPPAAPASESQVAAPAPASPGAAPAEAAPLPARATGLVSAEEGGFQIFDHILDEGVVVAPNEALLVVPSVGRGAASTLSIDGKTFGPLPAKTALSEGMHELAIARGDSVTYRFVATRAGRTWLLRQP
jgi:CheY-like chemotaxis protein